MRNRALVQVMPSTACNARCPYCYEEGHRILTMNNDVEHATARFVSSLFRDYERISLVWFGGEPLLCMEAIERLSAELSASPDCDRDRLSQSIITNGALLRAAMNRGFFDRCGITAIQVSMDGYGGDNARTKGFRGPMCSYHQLVDSIENCLIAGYQVTVRMNVSTTNEESLIALARDLKDTLGSFDSFSIYPAPLYGKGGQYLEPSHIGSAIRRLRNTIGHQRVRRRGSSWNCFDNCTYVVQPDGLVVPCEHLFGIEKHSLGNVLDRVGSITAKEMVAVCAMCSNVASCKQGCFSTDFEDMSDPAICACKSTLCWRRN